MTEETQTEETQAEETVDEASPEVTEETTEEATEEDSNAQYSKPLFTGDLGGHVLLDSTDGGAANFAAVVSKVV